MSDYIITKVYLRPGQWCDVEAKISIVACTTDGLHINTKLAKSIVNQLSEFGKNKAVIGNIVFDGDGSMYVPKIFSFPPNVTLEQVVADIEATADNLQQNFSAILSEAVRIKRIMSAFEEAEK